VEIVGRLLRILGVVTLGAASVNATAGLCFCPHGPDAPVSRPGHSCCLPSPGDDASGAIGADESCCHIEAAQWDLAPVDAIQIQASPATEAEWAADAGGVRLHLLDEPPAAPSPPTRILRL